MNPTMRPGLAGARLSLRLISVIAATTLYAVIAAGAVARDWSHFELLALAGQLIILLPALVYAWRAN